METRTNSTRQGGYRNRRRIETGRQETEETGCDRQEKQIEEKGRWQKIHHGPHTGNAGLLSPPPAVTVKLADKGAVR